MLDKLTRPILYVWFCMSNKMNANNLNFIEDLSSLKAWPNWYNRFKLLKKHDQIFKKLQAIWDDFQLIEFVIVNLWGFWVATSCIRTPLDEEAHHCGFALWLGTQDSRPSARFLCMWCTTAPAGSRSLWSTADIDPMGNCNICTLGKEVNFCLSLSIQLSS